MTDDGFDPQRLRRLDQVVAAEVERGRLPGAVVLLARGGQTVKLESWGRRDPAAPDPMRLDTIFRIYSMTKPLVSLATLMLAEEGRLSLADPLADYIPGFREPQVAVVTGEEVTLVPANRPITLQDLLRHTSGLTYEFMGPGHVPDLYAAARLGRRDQTTAEHAAELARLPLYSQPGSSWDYGRSTDVLGHVLELVSGQSLGEHLRDRITGPLGMVDTGFSVPPERHGRIAEPFRSDPETGEPVRLAEIRVPPRFESGGGGMVSTATDYGRFAALLLGRGAVDGVRLVSPATLAFMAADHLEPGTQIGSDILWPGYGFGLGLAVRRSTGLAPFPGLPGELSWSGMGGTTFWVDPIHDLAAIVMSQAPGRLEWWQRVARQLVYGALTG